MEGMYPFYYCTVCTRVDLSLKTEFGEASRRGSAQLPVNFAACGFRQTQPQQLKVESAYDDVVHGHGFEMSAFLTTNRALSRHPFLELELLSKHGFSIAK